MNNSTLTIRTVGFKRLCRGYFRVLFFRVLLSRRGCPSRRLGLFLARFGFQVDLFIGVVVPTTCSLTTCLTTCKGDRFHR